MAILSTLASVGNLLIQENNFLQGVSVQANQLHKDLQWMESLLMSADKKPSVRESIQPHISEFRAIAYEANDLVEDYVFRFASQNKEGFINTLKRYACIFCECYNRHNFGKEIQSLRNRISDLRQNFSGFGVPSIIEGEGSSSIQQQLRRTYSSFSESQEDFVGLEGDVSLLVNYLVNEDRFRHKSVVSICGMGGIGKTTLAKKVFHHLKVRQHFQGFAWFCISQQRSPKEILQGILVKLVPEKKSEIKDSEVEWLRGQLGEVLQGRRCLIILDDIWSNDVWDCIKPAFCIGENGSKILLGESGSKVLLTTRNRDVGVHVDPEGYHHERRLLTEEESWKLLEKKSLKNRSAQGNEDYHKLKGLGKEMVKYCGGLPLAVVVLGGILETKNSPTEWNVVLENVKPYIRRGEKIGQTEGEVPKILAFSYYDLPYQLKPCFVYMGKFEEDSNIEAERLYQLWIAEGMVLASDRIGQETMMEVAERYLEELAKRCMVQVELHEVGQLAITRFTSCRLHDLMRDLCLDKAKEENLYKVIDLSHQNSGAPSGNSSPAIERHYGFVLRSFRNDFDKYIPPSKEQTKHLRSFWCESLDWAYNDRCDGRRVMSQVNNFKMLRVLIIERYNMKSIVSQPLRCSSKSSLKCIGHLIHLRYLSLRYSKIWKFPSSWGNLNYLETLDLSRTECSEICHVLWKWGHLRHLYLRDFRRKLRFDGLGQRLEAIEGATSRNFDFKDLSKLTNLRSLKVKADKNLEDAEQIIDHISSLNYIRFSSLTILNCDFGIDSNSYNNKGSAVLEKLLFCKNLHHLRIYSTLWKQLPDYQPRLFPSSGLIELNLFGTHIEEDPMPTLEKFPKLRRLYLDNDSFVGKEMICHAMGFPQLKVLRLWSLFNLEKWKVDEGAMPKLSSLEISLCVKLEMIPDGLRSITTLKEIDLRMMPEEFNDRVQIVNGIEGPDFDKIRHVPSVSIRNR